MSRLRTAAEDYLVMRRTLGFKFRGLDIGPNDSTFGA
jgi:hypothetical protein